VLRHNPSIVVLGSMALVSLDVDSLEALGAGCLPRCCSGEIGRSRLLVRIGLVCAFVLMIYSLPVSGDCSSCDT
jgi:hypothetical protein